MYVQTWILKLTQQPLSTMPCKISLDLSTLCHLVLLDSCIFNIYVILPTKFLKNGGRRYVVKDAKLLDEEGPSNKASHVPFWWAVKCKKGGQKKYVDKKKMVYGREEETKVGRWILNISHSPTTFSWLWKVTSLGRFFCAVLLLIFSILIIYPSQS